jgi:hypothetical protein
LLPTKLHAGPDNEEVAERVADRIEFLIEERDAGRPLNLSEINYDEWQLIKLWDRSAKDHQRAFREAETHHWQRIEQIFIALLKR